jgi:hypothetical protein
MSAIASFYLLWHEDVTSTNGEAVPIEAVLDGLRILKTWLAQVDENQVGLLTIG